MENKMKAFKVTISSAACPFQGHIFVDSTVRNTYTIYFRQRSGRLIAYILPGKLDNEIKVLRYGWRFYDQPEKEEVLSIGELLERLNIQ